MYVCKLQPYLPHRFASCCIWNSSSNCWATYSSITCHDFFKLGLTHLWLYWWLIWELCCWWNWLRFYAAGIYSLNEIQIVSFRIVVQYEQIKYILWKRGPLSIGGKCCGGCDCIFCGGWFMPAFGGPWCCGGPEFWLKNAGFTCGAGCWPWCCDG